MKKIIAPGVFLILLALGYLYYSPYIMLNNIKEALENEDKIALRDNIDFPMVKDSVKEQLNVLFQEEMRTDENMFSELAAMAGNVMIDKMVDTYATPTGAINAYSAMNKKNKSKFPPDPANMSQPTTSALDNVIISRKGLDRFIIKDSKEQIIVTARRELLSWKIIDIDFMEAFKANKLEEKKEVDHAAYLKKFFERTCLAYSKDIDGLFKWANENMSPTDSELEEYYMIHGSGAYYLTKTNEEKCIATLRLPATPNIPKVHELYVDEGYAMTALQGSNQATVTLTKELKVTLDFSWDDKLMWLSLHAIEADKPRFGVNYKNLTSAQKESLGIEGGVEVFGIVEGTPVFNADILVGDVLVAYEGMTFSNSEESSKILKAISEDTKSVVFTLIRDGEKKEVVVKLL